MREQLVQDPALVKATALNSMPDITQSMIRAATIDLDGETDIQTTFFDKIGIPFSFQIRWRRYNGREISGIDLKPGEWGTPYEHPEKNLICKIMLLDYNEVEVNSQRITYWTSPRLQEEAQLVKEFEEVESRKTSSLQLELLTGLTFYYHKLSSRTFLQLIPLVGGLGLYLVFLSLFHIGDGIVAVHQI